MKVTDKGASATPVTLGIETTRTASPTIYVEEIPPQRKRQRAGDKDKEKADSCSSDVWGNARVAMARVQEIFTSDEMKVFSGSSLNELVGCHLHKLVQVMYLCKFDFSFFFVCVVMRSGSLLSPFFFYFFLFFFIIFFIFKVLGESLHLSSEYLAQEAKVESATSRVAVLEPKNSKLKKELITTIGEPNQAKEQVKTLSDDLRAERQLTLEKNEQLQAAKEKIKTIAIKAVEGFRQTEEYNTVLFSWYFKGFELLKRYFIKHPSGVDLENLDLEEVDKEMAANEALALDGDTSKSALPPLTGDDTAANA